MVIGLGKTVTVEMGARNFVLSVAKIERQAARLLPPWYLVLTMPAAEKDRGKKPGRLRQVDLT